MNKRQKEKKEKKNIIKDELIIDASGRRKIKIEIVDDCDLMTKENLDVLRKEFADISNDIKNTYYSSNATVERVEKRRFFDLLKLIGKMPNNKNTI